MTIGWIECVARVHSTVFYTDARRVLAFPSVIIFNCINTCPNSSPLNMRIRSLKASLALSLK